MGLSGTLKSGLKEILRPLIQKPEKSLWFDAPAYRKSRNYRGAPADLKAHADDLAIRGYTLVKSAVTPAVCDQLVTDFRRHCRETAEAKDYADGHGLHSRLTNFHIASEVARDVAFEPKVMRVVDFLFDAPGVAFSSLLFEKSTQQSLHRDCPFFRTEPEDLFFGVWTALEDVHPDAGPLFYYEGGHKFLIDPHSFGPDVPDGLTGDAAINWCYQRYIEQVGRNCEDQRLPLRTALIKKGDTFIWHGRLPHGGGKMKDPSRTRLSMVVHFMPEHVRMYGIEIFFNARERRPEEGQFHFGKHKGRSFVALPWAKFENNY